MSFFFFFFFFNDTATTEIYTLSLHDALPISEYERSLRWRSFLTPLSDRSRIAAVARQTLRSLVPSRANTARIYGATRSEEHTSELQSQSNLVCRLLLEKKKKKKNTTSL